MKLSDVGQILVFVISLTLFFSLPTSHTSAQIRTGSAENSVSISVEGEGNVKTDINQESQSLYKSSTSTSSNTHVTVEQNGNTQEFNSDGEDIHFVSDDGNVIVDVSNNGSPLRSESFEGQANESEEAIATDEVKTRAIKWIEKTEEEVLREETKSESFKTGTFLKPIDILMSVVTTIPSPVTQVDRLLNLIESAIHLL